MNVFISYVSQNVDHARRLKDDLSKFGVKAWLDRDEINLGLDWKDAIREAIRHRDFFIACFSKEYWERSKIGKSYMHEELTLAIEELRQYSPERSWFIPVKLSECKIPPLKISEGRTLRDIQWVELIRDWESGVKRIIKVIKPLPEGVKIMIDALKSSESAARQQAAIALGKIGDSVAIPALVGALKDPDVSVRSKATEALSIIGGETTIINPMETFPHKQVTTENAVSLAGDAFSVFKKARPIVLGGIAILSHISPSAAEAIAALVAIMDKAFKEDEK